MPVIRKSKRENFKGRMYLSVETSVLQEGKGLS
jgi:hypothetical protein